MTFIPFAALAEAPEAEPAEGDAAAEAFLTRCSGCHTLGGGAMKGPDLLPATQWEKPVLTAGVKRMEKQVGPLTPEQIDSLVGLLKDVDVKKRLAAERQRSIAQMAASLDAPNPKEGQALFFGRQAFSNGGLPCAACHRAGAQGGTLGPDLTTLKDKMPRLAMMSAFEKANFNVMRAAYADHPVTKQEALHLAGWFEALEAPSETPEQDAAWIVPAGVGLAFLLLLGLAAAFHNRGPAGMRARLVRDAQRS